MRRAPARPAGLDPIAPALRRWARALVGAALLGALAGAGAAGFVALDLEQRLAAAHEAAVGVVVDVDVEVRDGDPWTLVTLEVERWWRRAGVRVAPDGAVTGGAGAAVLTAAFWGGRATGVAPLQVAGMPGFVPGERVLWLLRRADEGLGAPTVGVTQGVWRDAGGGWRGDDGTVLGVGEAGELRLGGQPVPDAILFTALDTAFGELEATP